MPKTIFSRPWRDLVFDWSSQADSQAILSLFDLDKTGTTNP
jgi:hypothetical protein